MSSDSANVSQSGIIKRLEALLAKAVLGASKFPATANNQSAVAGNVAPVAAPYTAISAPSIAKKVSGKFLVTGFVTIDKNGGTLAAGDAIMLEPQVNGVQYGTMEMATAAVASGGAGDIQAYVPFSFIADEHASAGPFVFSMSVQTAGAAHTSGVLASNGFISVIELAG